MALAIPILKSLANSLVGHLRSINWARSWLDLPPDLLSEIAPAYGGVIHHFSKPFVGISCTNTLILENLDCLVEARLIISA